MNRLLWIVQILLALLFLYAGVIKLALPMAVMTAQFPLPGVLLHLVAVCEILGAFGLVLPGWLGIRRALTPLAAVGLVIIMIGACLITARMMGFLPALFPLAVGVLLAFVAYKRWNWLRSPYTAI